MAAKGRSTTDDRVDLQRTRASSVWVTIAIAVLFLILLIIFIAQNNTSVPLHFFTLAGHVSEALALVVAAVGGALVVLIAGSTRILQLRVRAHRTNKAADRAAASSAPVQGSTSAAATSGTVDEPPTQAELDSAVAASKREA